MDEPEVGREYHFVRRRDDGIDYARFIYFEDGSAILDEGGYGYNFDNAAEAWRRPFAELKRLGYFEIAEAVRHGIVSSDEARWVVRRT